MKNITLLRLKHTAKLEKMIEKGDNYDKILKQSKKLDKFIITEMQRININQSIDKTQKNL